MDPQTFETARQQVQDAREQIMGSKGKAYRNSTDVLANFKRIASALGLESSIVCLVYLTKHIDSLHTWTKEAAKAKENDLSIKETSGGEHIVGRIVDVLNYTDLFLACIIDDFGIVFPEEEDS